MKILFRTDSGNHIGTGHIRRCLTLARALQKHGHQVLFLSRKHEGNILDQVRKEFEVTELSGGVFSSQNVIVGDYASWLGVDLATEIDESRKVLRSYNFDKIVIDHYALDEEYESSLGHNGVMVIDDLINRSHDCKYLLNQNLFAKKELYKDLIVAPDCHLMMGPQYALLKPDFALKRPQVFKPRTNKIKNILVFFGGNDLTNESRKLIDGFLLSDRGPVKNLKIILDSGHKDYDFILRKSKIYKNINLVSYIEDMAQELMMADLCIGAAGSTSWERACLGIPSLIVISADNQKMVADSLVKTNSAYFVGDARETTPQVWREVFQKIDSMNLSLFAKNSYEICDGRGLERVLMEAFDVKL